MTSRRQFLGAAAALTALQNIGDKAESSGEPDEPASEHPGDVNVPLEGCFGTLDLLVHDETIDVDIITVEGQGYGQSAILRLRMSGGSLAVTLLEEDINAIIEALDTTPSEVGYS